MDGAYRPAQDTVALFRRLGAGVSSYRFFDVVRLLTRCDPDAPAPGHAGPYPKESIRFRHTTHMGFDSGEIEKISFDERDDAGGDDDADDFDDADLVGDPGSRYRIELTSCFMGLAGSVSPLPNYIPEEIQSVDDDSQLKREFLDIFHHRLIGLMYRSVMRLNVEHAFDCHESDPWSLRVLAYLGFDAYRGHDTKYVQPHHLLQLSSLLANDSRSGVVIAQALNRVLEPYLGGAKCRIEEFSGGWSPIDRSQQMQLAVKNSFLGINSIIGTKCLHRAGGAKIVIEPLDDQHFRHFLRHQAGHETIAELLDIMVSEPIEFGLDLVVSSDRRLSARLGQCKLGVDQWLFAEDGPKLTRLSVDLERGSDRRAAAPSP